MCVVWELCSQHSVRDNSEVYDIWQFYWVFGALSIVNIFGLFSYTLNVCCYYFQDKWWNCCRGRMRGVWFALQIEWLRVISPQRTLIASHYQKTKAAIRRSLLSKLRQYCSSNRAHLNSLSELQTFSQSWAVNTNIPQPRLLLALRRKYLRLIITNTEANLKLPLPLNLLSTTNRIAIHSTLSSRRILSARSQMQLWAQNQRQGANLQRTLPLNQVSHLLNASNLHL